MRSEKGPTGVRRHLMEKRGNSYRGVATFLFIGNRENRSYPLGSGRILFSSRLADLIAVQGDSLDEIGACLRT